MISIRIAQNQDVQELVRLSSQLGYPCSIELCQKLLADLERDPDHVVLVAENQEKIIAGYVHVFKTKRLFLEPFGELGGLIVEENFRGEGVGKNLLAASENWADEHGCCEMRVRCNVIREKAHIFYLDQGYLINKQQKIFIKELPEI